MGFKADTSFLKFLTMGARGAHHTIAHLRNLGFKPIELERYCGSNKIWSTKVKRLRLPDLLCVKTGLRVEVRAKSDLKIRMSDAPNNPDRAWDAGLRDEDVVGFVACADSQAGPTPLGAPTFFTVDALRASAVHSILGPPKSASEGAERDRTWPATVPVRDGRVMQVTSDRIRVQMYATQAQSARNQSFSLKGKTAYVRQGDEFKADSTFLSGAPSSTADLTRYLSQTYDPLADMTSANSVDRYAAVKAVRFRDDIGPRAVTALENVIRRETEPRIRLEAGGSAAYLGSQLGQDTIQEFVRGQQDLTYLRMESVLITTELVNTGFARQLLNDIANCAAFVGNEVRQAAVWGLGKAGLKAYEDLLPFLADEEEDVVLHAIAAFGDDVPMEVVNRLIEHLVGGDHRIAPAASEALRLIGTSDICDSLVRAYNEQPAARDWILATLGRLPPRVVTDALNGTPILESLRPMLLVAPGANWLTSEETRINMSFLQNQNI